MILVITTSFNFSIQSIVNFFIDEQIEFLRLNVDDLISEGNLPIEIHNSEIFIQGTSSEKIEKVICWKSNIDVIPSLYKKAYPSISEGELFYKSAELQSVLRYIVNRLSSKLVFGYLTDDLDKLSQNYTARQVGLQVPNTFVSNQLKTFDSIQKEQYIAKPIMKTFVSKFDKSFVEKLNNVVLDSKRLKTTFPFLSQKMVEYDFEIRVFYVNNAFYSAKLIKPAKDLDYRLSQAYHFQPFTISNDLQLKLKKFIKGFRLKTACFDLLIKNDQVWFLESNPTGNFIALMNECEYDLHAVFSDVFNSPLSIAI